jgi:hypothetical protein
LAKELWASYVKHPKEVERAKAKEPSVHRIEFRNESEIFTMQDKKAKQTEGCRSNQLVGLAYRLKESSMQT